MGMECSTTSKEGSIEETGWTIRCMEKELSSILTVELPIKGNGIGMNWMEKVYFTTNLLHLFLILWIIIISIILMSAGSTMMENFKMMTNRERDSYYSQMVNSFSANLWRIWSMDMENTLVLAVK